MSAPLTKAKEAVGRRSRLEIVQAALAKDEAELEAARARFVELAAKEDEAVRESKRADPEASPYKLRAPAQLIREEREKLTKTIDGLEKGLAALQAELQILAAERAEKRLAEATIRTRRLAEQERELVRSVSGLLSSIVPRWNDRVRLLEERRALAASVRVDGLVPAVSATRPDLVERWEQAVASTLAPQAVTFSGFVNALLHAALTDRPDVEAELRDVDELNRRRLEQARKDPGGADDLPMVPKPVIRIDPLQELVVDLRDDVKVFDPTVGGTPLARPDEGMIEGLAEAGFGLGAVFGYSTDGNVRVPWRRSPGPPETA